MNVQDLQQSQGQYMGQNMTAYDNMSYPQGQNYQYPNQNIPMQNNQGMGGFNGLGQNYMDNNGAINIGQPDYSYNPQNNVYTPNPNKGFSIGTIEGQDLRIGDGELLRFLKSLF
jgi:hypothetical protein